MNQFEQALWLIENHKFEAFGLAELADRLSVSKFHLSRSFSAATGRSVSGYIRARRLAEAAKTLQAGSTSILDVALAVGYNSHEAFTRAFTRQFGLTPIAYRDPKSRKSIALQEQIQMEIDNNYPLSTPRIETSVPMNVAGINRHYTWENRAGIPGQWIEFAQHFDLFVNNKSTSFGIAHNIHDEDGMEYLTGLDVRGLKSVPPEFQTLEIPALKCAVFTHQGNVSLIVNTWNAIFTRWINQTDHILQEAPQWERYGEDFNPMSGEGTIEIWIPIEG